MRQTAGLAKMLYTEPRAFPGALAGEFKRAFRAVWSARGGGLYACGFFLTFVWLEVRTLFSEVLAADSVTGFVTEQLFEFVIRFTLQSIENTVQALLWPVFVIRWSPAWGFVALAATYFVFATFLKKPLERWLFDDELEDPGDRPANPV